MVDTNFLNELNIFEQQMIQECEQFARDVAGEILDEITDTNALDTGRCTASWTASVNNPIYNEATDVTEANRIGRETAKERSLSTLPNLQQYKLGDTIYLSNGASYVSGIEDGMNSVRSINFVKLAALQYDSVIDWQLNPSV